MDQQLINALLQGGGLLAFATFVYLQVRELNHILRNQTEILRVIEERTAHLVEREAAPVRMTRSDP